MAVNTKDNTSTIKKKDKESLLGQTDANTTVIGRTASSTERVFIIQAKEKLKWVNGQKVNVSTGSMTRAANEHVNLRGEDYELL